MFIGLNPSTADERVNDPTVRRCISFAQNWGYSALAMTNLFGWRATLPKDMKRQSDPIGAWNDAALLRVASTAGVVVAAWGVHGSWMNRAETVWKLLKNAGIAIKVLKLNMDGSPCHPLYLASTLIPVDHDKISANTLRR